ncbi:MAG: insulinase family protein [Bacteroidaceae bacterium]|nr:insulinase family protein [Bacteroidaceae bacterium]
MIHTLPNGLRIIYEHRDAPVVYCGYVVCCGTRHEDAADSGMAHFIEHMTFKGTQRRRSHHITNCLERVGGDLNASTSKQETVYTATVLRKDVARAIDLLSDIVFHSTYPQAEIDREVEVICDEIDSYLDSPAELIFDEFESMLFDQHPLGRDILGQAQRLRTYTTADAQRFARQYYVPANCAFYIYGNVNFKQVVRDLERATADVPLGALPKNQVVPHVYVPMHRQVDKQTHQAHVVLGAPTFGADDDRRFALLLLNNILGGPGMNSRLNTSVREKAGLVYSIDSYLNTYPDCGFWNIYFGCDPKDVRRCINLVHRELNKLVTTPLTQQQLRAAKQQLIGQIGISCDSSEGYAIALGKTFAHYGVHRDVQNICSEVEAVTPELLQKVAQEVYDPTRITSLIYQ